MKGKDRGKAGSVLRVDPDANRVTVEGMNVAKKHVRPKKEGEKGQTVEVVRSVAASNVRLVCPRCSAVSRTGYRVEGENKIRFCKACNASVEK